MEKFLANYVSEALLAASPHAEEVGIVASEETATMPHPGKVGSEPILEVVVIASVRERERRRGSRYPF